MKYKNLVLLLIMGCALAIDTIKISDSNNAAVVDQFVVKTKEVMIFDCGGVLVDVSKHKTMRWIGLSNLVKRLVANGFSGKKIRTEYMTELHRLSPAKPHHIGITDEHGNQLPGILCQWMLSEKSNQELLEEIHNLANNDEHLKNQCSKRRALLAIIENMLITERFVDTLYIREDMISFLEACAQATDENGNKRYTILILSNYNEEAFELLLEKFPRIKNNIDGYFISGAEQCGKPHEIFYEKFMKHFNINPQRHTCYFIDDQEPNRITGNKFGFISVHPDALERDGDNYYLWVPKKQSAQSVRA